VFCGVEAKGALKIDVCLRQNECILVLSNCNTALESITLGLKGLSSAPKGHIVNAPSNAEATQAKWSIADVERETGLGKDTLRVWERRYGFPHPDRDGQGDRTYDSPQLARLRLIKRLLERGYRPGKVVSLSIDALYALIPAPDVDVPQVARQGRIRRAALAFSADWIDRLKTNEFEALRANLRQTPSNR
jgi:MerR HTH family regulatory protein